MPCQRSRLERQSLSNPYCLFAINVGLFTVKKNVIDQLRRIADRSQKRTSEFVYASDGEG